MRVSRMSAVVALIVLTLAAQAQVSRPEVVSGPALSADMERRWERDFKSGEFPKGFDAQLFASFVLDGVQAGFDENRLVTVLGYIEKVRDTNQHSTTFGNISWYIGDSKVNDANAVEFTNRQLIGAWYLMKDRPDSILKQALRMTIMRDLAGIHQHQVRTDYTNIALMRSANLILSGEALGDKASLDEGLAYFKSWRTELKANGVHEYLSPTYNQVDLENLGLLYNLSGLPDVRAWAKAGLDLIWLQILSNWYQPSARMGGTHSRDYDRLYGHAGLDRWVGRLQGDEAYQGMKLSAFEGLCWYQPDLAFRRYLGLDGTEAGKTVALRFGPDQWASQWMGHNVSLATSSELYYNMDKTPLVVNLGSGEAPVINFWMDGRGDHYGKDLILESSGHMKSLHLRPLLAAAQEGHEALFLAYGSRENESKLESNITLPADARYFIDGKELQFSHTVSRWKPDLSPDNQKTFITVFKERGKDLVEIRDQDSTKGVGLSQVLPAQPKNKYEIRILGRGGTIYLYLNFLGADGQLVDRERSVAIKGSPDTAAPLTGTFSAEAPEGTAAVKAWIYSTSTNLTDFILEDVQVIETDSRNQSRQLAGFDFQSPVPYDKELTVGQTLFVLRQDAACALRLVTAEDTRGNPVPFHLVNDGLEYGALRLTAVQGDKTSDGKALCAFYVRVAEGLNGANFAEYQRSVMDSTLHFEHQGDTITFARTGLDKPLSASLEGTKRVILPRPDPLPILSIDGRDLGSELIHVPGF